MPDRPSAPLPEFENPPVTEVALSIMFEPLTAYRAVHAGVLWREYETEFPVVDEQPELDLVIEQPRGPQAPPVPRFDVMEKPKVRTWFLTKLGNRLIQVQDNRFVYNWRRREPSEPYPRYSAVRAEFDDVFAKFRSFVEGHGLGTIKPVQAEVTYVNHIVGEHGQHDRVAEVLTSWRKPSLGSSFLPGIEDVRVLAQYPMADQAGRFLGRLSVNLQPAYVRSTGAQILSLTMVARGRPVTPDVDGALQFLDIGHEWIVRGFAEITTAEMQSVWRRSR